MKYVIISWLKSFPGSAAVWRGTGEDAKLFKSREEAKAWAETNLNWNYKVVELSMKEEV